MALIDCPECQKQISTHAKTCPSCGCPNSLNNNNDNNISIQKKQSYSTPKIKATLRPVGLILGLFLIISGGYLLFDYIPQHDPGKIEINNPIDIAKAVSQGYYHPDNIEIFKIASWVIIFIGIIQIITGSIKKVNTTLYCKKCDLQVGIKKLFSGNFCERCDKKLNRGNFLRNIIAIFILIVSLCYLLSILFKFSSKETTFQNKNKTVKKVTVSSAKEKTKNDATIVKKEAQKQLPIYVSWGEKNKETVENFIYKNKSIFAKVIIGATHPTGKNPRIVNTNVIHSNNNIKVQFFTEWQGGFSGKKYNTSVTWKFDRNNSFGITINNDTAITGIDEENKVILNDFFQKKIYSVLKQNLID